MWTRPKDAADELSGKFWAATTGLYLRETLLGVDLGGVPSFWESDGGPWGHGWGRWPPGTWMRPKDVVDGLLGKVWAATT